MRDNVEVPDGVAGNPPQTKIMSDIKEQSKKRRDNRHTKNPEIIFIVRRMRARPKNKPFKLMCKIKKTSRWCDRRKKELSSLGKYVTHKDAEQALKKYGRERYFSENYDLWIDSTKL